MNFVALQGLNPFWNLLIWSYRLISEEGSIRHFAFFTTLHVSQNVIAIVTFDYYSSFINLVLSADFVSVRGTGHT